MLGLRERMEENGSAPGTGEAKRSAAAPADPEVVDRPLRRRFSPSYKLRIVEEADRCTEPGEVGQVLRREGLYSSHLRHTCATLLLAANAHPKIVSERLGHSSVTLTMDTYSHVLPTMQDGPAERLEEMLFG